MQDSLAHAVADEMQKIYQNELGPQPVPLTVTGEAVDEEDVSLFVPLIIWNCAKMYFDVLFSINLKKHAEVAQNFTDVFY